MAVLHRLSMRKGVADIGNTRVKTAVFSPEGELLKKAFFSDPDEAFEWLKTEEVSEVMAASVGQQIIGSIPGLKIHSLSSHSRLPFTNLYQSPETLGVDRIAAMAAAAVLFPGKPVLVFDIGTCMTIDLLEADKTYRGGNISPGIQMRLKAMQQMTGRLPLSSPEHALNELGHDTLSALAAGALKGMQHEIEGYLQYFVERYPGLQTVVCGGDYTYFEFPQKYGIFAAPDFVLQGLYHLLTLNEQ